MPQTCNFDFISDKKIASEVKGLANAIIKKIKPQQVILFGSLTRGDIHEASDIDLVVVADFKEQFFDRIGKILKLNNTSMDLEVMAYTPAEFAKMQKEERPFIINLLQEGRVIYKH